MTKRISGIYGILPSGLTTADLLHQAEQALQGGVRLLQFRDKDAGYKKALKRAKALRQLTLAYDARLVVNDSVQMAVESGADGVHLGRADGSIAEARALLGPDRIIGVSCYADPERARRLAGEGADYLAFGSLFASPTKPDAVSCPLAVLGEARKFGLPVVAIGGITLHNAPEAIDAGADLVAVISDLFDAPDRRMRAAEYAAVLSASEAVQRR